MNEEMKRWYLDNGFTLMGKETAPAIGERFKAARVIVDRGFGGVILKTRRLEVTATRTSEFVYRDDLNGVDLSPGEIEAWRPLPPDQGN